MKTLFTNFLALTLISFLWNNSIFCQGINLSYEIDLTDIDYIEGTYGGKAILHTSNGFALYYGSEKTGFDDFIKLRNNNTIVWKTQVDKYPDNITPYKFYENESGYYFVGDFSIGSHSGGIGRLNKSTGNFEVKKRFNDLQNPGAFAINGTHGGNIIVGGSMDIGNGLMDRKAMLRVVNSNGDVLTTKNSNNTGGIWGNVVEQIEKTNDNGYIASGIIFENTICGEPNNSSWWICKLNSNLDVVWSRKYGNGNGTVRSEKIVVLENNEIVALGQTYCTNGNGGGFANEGEGTWLVKLSTSGTLVKQRFIGANYQDYTQNYSDLEKSCDQKIILAGVQGSLLGISYFLEKFDYSLEYISEPPYIFGQSDFPYSQIKLQIGKDKSYLISGVKNITNSNGNIVNLPFIAKTMPDPACGTNPSLLLCDNTFGEFSICEDFDKLQNGNIVPQGSPKFSLFSGSTDENAFVNTEKAFSGTKSLKFTDISDIDFNIDRTIQSPSRLEWMTYIDVGKTGSWGLETSNPNSYALVTRLNNGQGTVYTVSSSNQLETKGTFTFTPGQWYKTALVFNNTENTIEVWINNKMIYSRSGHTSRLISDLNFYGTSGSANNLFYIDNLIYYETKISCNCTTLYDPVCVNGKEFSNSCNADCAGYTTNEWTVGPCNGSNPTNLVFDIEDNICGSVGQIVTIPVRVKGFSKVSSFQFSISLADISKGEITGIEKGNIAGDLNYSIASASTATIVWDNVSPIDLADNYVVFNIKLKIKSAFTGTTDINITGNPTDISAEQNNKTVKPSVIKGSFCSTAASTFKICGKIIREDNVAVPNVLVTLSGGKSATTNTNSIGEYCFDNLNANLSYTVKPSKNTDHKNGVNTGDVTAIRRHILALEKLNSPYKIIAADASKSNVVNTGDVTEIRKLILALISQFSTTESWSFVPESHVFSNPANPFAASIPNSLIINNLNSNLSDQNFIGIKIGDVNLNNTPSNIIETAENRSSNNINLIVGSANVKTNQNFDIDITVKQFNEITSGQFSVNWNTNISEFISLKNLNSILGLTNDNFNLSLTSGGKLGFLWDSPTPVTLPDNIKLFSISFKAKSNGSASINITDDPVAKYFENKDQQGLNIIVSNGIVTVPTTELYGNEKVYIYPNPTNDFVNFESDYNIRSIEILNCTGENIRKISGLNASKGLVDLSDQISGIYFLKFRTDEGDVFRKINLIK